jgi:xanthine dehydrogenase accessory factor
MSPSAAKRTVMIRGCGDVGSAVAHFLFGAGYRVVIHDDPRPAHTRRGMAFTDALFEHKSQLAGVWAKHQVSLEAIGRMLDCGKAVAVATGEFDGVAERVRPDVLVDARMRKRSVPEVSSVSMLTIGLGPNFVAGQNADLAIETAWGDDLGRVIERGPTRPLEGEPQEIRGHARDRYVYAPVAGMFVTPLEIGAAVEAGSELARIGETVLRAPLPGRLRGLTHTNVYVERGTKLIEVDPRGDQAQIRGIGERPGRIAEGVLAALKNRS